VAIPTRDGRVGIALARSFSGSPNRTFACPERGTLRARMAGTTFLPTEPWAGISVPRTVSGITGRRAMGRVDLRPGTSVPA